MHKKECTLFPRWELPALFTYLNVIYIQLSSSPRIPKHWQQNNRIIDAFQQAHCILKHKKHLRTISARTNAFGYGPSESALTSFLDDIFRTIKTKAVAHHFLQSDMITKKHSFTVENFTMLIKIPLIKNWYIRHKESIH